MDLNTYLLNTEIIGFDICNLKKMARMVMLLKVTYVTYVTFSDIISDIIWLVLLSTKLSNNVKNVALDDVVFEIL